MLPQSPRGGRTVDVRETKPRRQRELGGPDGWAVLSEFVYMDRKAPTFPVFTEDHFSIKR